MKKPVKTVMAWMCFKNNKPCPDWSPHTDNTGCYTFYKTRQESLHSNLTDDIRKIEIREVKKVSNL